MLTKLVVKVEHPAKDGEVLEELNFICNNVDPEKYEVLLYDKDLGYYWEKLKNLGWYHKYHILSIEVHPLKEDVIEPMRNKAILLKQKAEGQMFWFNSLLELNIKHDA